MRNKLLFTMVIFLFAFRLFSDEVEKMNVVLDFIGRGYIDHGKSIPNVDLKKMNDILYTHFVNCETINLITYVEVNEYLARNNEKTLDMFNKNKKAHFAKEFNVDWIIQGQIGLVDNQYRIFLSIENLKLMRFLRNFDIFIDEGALSVAKLKPFYNDFLEHVEWSNYVLNREATEKIYSLGETGPSGGIVFYDRGNFEEKFRF